MKKLLATALAIVMCVMLSISSVAATKEMSPNASMNSVVTPTIGGVPMEVISGEWEQVGDFMVYTFVNSQIYNFSYVVGDAVDVIRHALDFSILLQ